MTALYNILASLGMLASVGGAVVGSVFALAAAANTAPEQLRQIYLAIGVMVLLAAAGVSGALLLMKAGHAGWAALASFAPLVLMLAALVKLLN